MHLDHKQPFHDAVWALEHKCSWKVPQLDGLGVSIILGDLLAMSMKQLLEGLKNWESYLNSLHPLLKLHLKQFFRNKVSKSLDTDTQSLRRFLLLHSCYSISYLLNVSYPVFLSSPNKQGCIAVPFQWSDCRTPAGAPPCVVECSSTGNGSRWDRVCGKEQAVEHLPLENSSLLSCWSISSKDVDRDLYPPLPAPLS